MAGDNINGIGAWERPEINNQLVTIGIPHREICHVKWAIALSNIQRTVPCVYSLSKGQPWDVSRNSIVHDALGAGSSHLLFLDTDVIPPPDGLTRLLQHNLPVVSGLYYCRHRTDLILEGNLPVPVPPTPAMWVENAEGTYNPIIKWENTLVQCDVVGAGFVLIHTSVFERLNRELDRNGVFFKWTSDINDEEYCEHLPGVSEDFFFFRMLKQIGIPVYVDTSIKCEHMSMSIIINEKGLDFSGI